MKTVYLTYWDDGSGERVEAVFGDYHKAYNHVAKYYKGRSWTSGWSEEKLNKAIEANIHEFDVQ